MAAVALSTLFSWSTQICGNFGPYQGEDGTLYVVGNYDNSGTNNMCVAYSTDDGATWSYVNTAGTSGTTTVADSFYEPTTKRIYILQIDGSLNVRIYEWLTTTKAFSSEIYSSGTRPTVLADANSHYHAFFIRRTDGSFVVTFSQAASAMGNSFVRTYAGTCTSTGTWSAFTEVDTFVKSNSYWSKGIVLGDLDRAHIIYASTPGNVQYSRSFSSGGVFDTQQTLVTGVGGLTLMNVYYHPGRNSITVDTGGLTNSKYAPSVANPTWNWISTPPSDGSSASSVAYIYTTNSKKEYALYRSTTNDDIYRVDVDGGSTAWNSSSTLLDTATTPLGISAGPIYFGSVLKCPGTSSDSATAIGNASASASRAMSFTPTVSCSIKQFLVRLNKVGNPTDNLQITLFSDDGGGTSLPLTRLVATVSIAGSSLTTSFDNYIVDTTQAANLTAGTKYWIVFERSSGSVDASNYYQISRASTNWSTAAEAVYNSGTGAWSIDSNNDFVLSIFPRFKGIGFVYNDNGTVYYDIYQLLFDYTDSATITSVTSPSGTDLLPTTYTDAATISSVTAPSGSFQYDERGQYDIVYLLTSGDQTNVSNPALYYAQRVVGKTASDVISIDILFGKLGNPTDNIIVEWHLDDTSGGGGQPHKPGILLDSAQKSASSIADGSVQTFVLSTSQFLSASATRWIVIRRSGATDNANTLTIYRNTNNPYPDGYSSNSTNGGSTWTDDVNTDISFAVRVTASAPTSITSVSSSEVYTPASGGTPYTDSATVSSVTTPSSAEIAAFVDAATVGGSTNASGPDIAATIESSTIAGTSTPSGADVFAAVDGSTASSTTSPSGTDLLFATDSATISGVTTPSSTDQADYLDSFTVNSVTAPSAVELHETFDAATTSGTTTPSATEVAGYVDAATTTAITTPISAELHETFDSATITGVTAPTAVEVSDFVEAFTIASATTPSSTETHEIPDTGTVSGTTTPSSTDLAEYVDASTITESTSITATEIAGFVDSDTVSGATIASGADLADYADLDTTASVTTPSSSDVAAFVDANTARGWTAPIWSGYTNDFSTSLGWFDTINNNGDPITISGGKLRLEALVAGNQFSYTDTGVDTFDPTERTVGITLSSLVDDGGDGETDFYISNGAGIRIQTFADGTGGYMFRIIGGHIASSYIAITLPVMYRITHSGGTVTIDYSTDNGGSWNNALTSTMDTFYYVQPTTISPFPTFGLEVFSGTTVDQIAEYDDFYISDPSPIVDISAYVESATISSVTELSGVDVYTPLGGIAYTDAETVASVTTVQSAELREITDAATVSGTTQGTSVDIAETVEAATTASTTTVDTIDTAAVLDAATVSNTSSLTSVERADYADSDTTSSATEVTYAEISEYSDSSTVAGNTTADATELHELFDAATPTGATTPSSADIAAFVESATVTATTDPSGSTETFGHTDSDTVSSTTTITAVEVTAVVDSTTLQSATAISSTELAEYVDAATASSKTEVFSDEIAAGVKATTLYRTRLTSLYPPSPLDPETLSVRARKANPTDSGIARITFYSASTQIDTWDIALTDSFVTTDHTLLNTNLIADWSDLEVTIQGFSTAGDDLTVQISSIQFTTPAYSTTEYTDANTVSSVTDVSSTDVAAYVDLATISGSTTPDSVEVAAYVDSDTVKTSAEIGSAEVTTNVDVATIASVSSLSYVEVTEVVDAATVSAATSVSSTEFAAYLDAQTISGITTGSATYAGVFVDADTATAITTPTSFEGQTNVYLDSGTGSTTTTPTSVEYAGYVDYANISGVNNISSTEYQSAVDAGSISGASSASSVDLAGYVDADTTASVSTPIGVDIYGRADTSTVPSFTSITYTELTEYADAATLASSTIPSVQETTAYADYGLTGSLTYVTTEEEYKTPVEETAVITSVTTVIGVEFILTILVDLTVIATFPRWNTTGTQKRYSPVGVFKQWFATTIGFNYTAEAKRKWAAWTR